MYVCIYIYVCMWGDPPAVHDILCCIFSSSIYMLDKCQNFSSWSNPNLLFTVGLCWLIWHCCNDPYDADEGNLLRLIGDGFASDICSSLYCYLGIKPSGLISDIDHRKGHVFSSRLIARLWCICYRVYPAQRKVTSQGVGCTSAHLLLEV